MTKTDITPRENGGRADLSKWAWGPFEALHDDIDRLFGRYVTPGIERVPSLFHRGGTATGFAKMDVSETKDSVEIKIDVPGMDVKDIEVTLTDNTLTVKGTREAEEKEENADYYRLERSFGSFQRQIELPAEVDEKKIEAAVKQGVLSLHLPKSDRAKSRAKKIPIKAA